LDLQSLHDEDAIRRRRETGATNDLTAKARLGAFRLSAYKKVLLVVENEKRYDIRMDCLPRREHSH